MHYSVDELLLFALFWFVLGVMCCWLVIHFMFQFSF